MQPCIGRAARYFLAMLKTLSTGPLPIEPLLPGILASLREKPNLVLEAPPGAGKTTRVPLALLEEGYLPGKIVILEPRRLAARAAAARMAASTGEAVGGTVGYAVRMDRKIGPDTRIEAVTTGLFLRTLQGDPALSGISAVLFDEFHERSLEADLALAFCIEAQAALRPDLRIVVMSATLDGERIRELLPDAALLRSEGRLFPVDLRYRPMHSGARLDEAVSKTIHESLRADSGDILVFLPGGGEIRRVAARLGDIEGCAILPLHGDLPLEAQDRVLKPAPHGCRKIILSTAIAETSLTIEGVRVVIDAGLRRAPRFDPDSGMTRLMTLRAPASSAAQRAGRAGRTAPGVCYRLWSEPEQRALAPFAPPEILEADLASFALELAAWGAPDPAGLSLPDQPPPAAFAQARALLKQLGALDEGGRITPHGQAMAAFGTHPRLAHMLLRAKEYGDGPLACDIAAILGERDFLKAERGSEDADLRHRVEILHGHEKAGFGLSADPGLLRRVREAAKDWRRQLDVREDADAGTERTGAILALAYPDRIAQRRGPRGSCKMSNGKSATLPAHDPLAGEDFIAIAALDGDRRDARVFMAAPLSPADIETLFSNEIETSDLLGWSRKDEAVLARRQRKLWSLVLEEKPLEPLPPGGLAAAMLDGVRDMGLAALPFTDSVENFRARVHFMRQIRPEDGWPDLSDAALLENLDGWLGPFLSGCSRRAHLGRVDIEAALLPLLSWEQRSALDRLAPTHIAAPSGSRIPVDYKGEEPVLAVRIQEMFGVAESPRIADGRVPLLLHLLSPARRPLQVTRDLASFWANGYRHVKADMKGRYPRHYWPDDPLAAEPAARAKPRGVRQS